MDSSHWTNNPINPPHTIKLTNDIPNSFSIITHSFFLIVSFHPNPSEKPPTERVEGLEVVEKLGVFLNKAANLDKNGGKLYHQVRHKVP